MRERSERILRRNLGRIGGKGHKKRAADVTIFQEGKEVICGVVVGPPLAPTFLSAAQKSVC